MCLAIPGKIVEIDGHRATVEFGSVRRTIDLRLVDNPAPGDYVLVHAGFAINKIDQEEARRTLELIAEMELAATPEAVSDGRQEEHRDGAL